MIHKHVYLNLVNTGNFFLQASRHNTLFFSCFRMTFAHLKAGDAMFKVVRVNDSTLLASTVVKNVSKKIARLIIMIITATTYLLSFLPPVALLCPSI